jgi:hypothetical protein
VDKRLQEVARHLVRAGKLPSDSHSKSYGGKSSGAECSLCVEMIAPDAVEVELVQQQDDQEVRCLLHPECHIIWYSVVAPADSTGTA